MKPTALTIRGKEERKEQLRKQKKGRRRLGSQKKRKRRGEKMHEKWNCRVEIRAT